MSSPDSRAASKLATDQLLLMVELASHEVETVETVAKRVRLICLL